MVLGDDFNREVVFEDVDVGVLLQGLDEALLDFRSRVVSVVKDSEFRVAALAVEVELTVRVLVDINALVNSFLNLRRCILHDFLHGRTVAEPVAGNHRVLDVLVEVVNA